MVYYFAFKNSQIKHFELFCITPNKPIVQRVLILSFFLNNFWHNLFTVYSFDKMFQSNVDIRLNTLLLCHCTKDLLLMSRNNNNKTIFPNTLN